MSRDRIRSDLEHNHILTSNSIIIGIRAAEHIRIISIFVEHFRYTVVIVPRPTHRVSPPVIHSHDRVCCSNDEQGASNAWTRANHGFSCTMLDCDVVADRPNRFVTRKLVVSNTAVNMRETVAIVHFTVVSAVQKQSDLYAYLNILFLSLNHIGVYGDLHILTLKLKSLG